MTKYIVALSVLLLTISVAMATAQQTPEKPTQKPAKVMAGQVTSVDATHSQIVIKDETAKEIALLVSGDAAITKEGKTITLADIKAGDWVTSECIESSDGCKVTAIRVTAAKPSK